MFRKMRRKAQQLTQQETLRVLEYGRTGVLAVNGDGGYPYAVPLNYVWDGEAVYFHCACEGHKTDALNSDSRVSFCVVERDTVVPQLFATDYRSAILFGRAQAVQEDEERRYALERLNQKYAPDLPEEGQREIAEAFSRVCIIKLVPEHLSGKAAAPRVQQAGKETGK